MPRPPTLLAVLALVAPAIALGQPVHAAAPRDAGRIVFTSDRTGNFEIFAMNADGSGVTRLTDDPELDDEPAWSPDGSKIVWRTNRTGNPENFVMDAGGGNLKNLSRERLVSRAVMPMSPADLALPLSGVV